MGPSGPLRMRLVATRLAALDGDHAAAFDAYEALAADAREVLGESHETTMLMESYLVEALIERDRYGDAEALVRSLIARIEQRDPHSPFGLVQNSALAAILARQNEYEEAAALYESLVERYVDTFGEEHSWTAVLMNDLASVYLRAGQHARAVPILEEVARYREKNDGPQHSQTLTVKGNLALALAGIGDARAEPMLRSGYETRLELFGPEHHKTLHSQIQWARVLRQERRFDIAEPPAPGPLGALPGRVHRRRPRTASIGGGARNALLSARQARRSARAPGTGLARLPAPRR